MAMDLTKADLVLEGGGVKGIALVGAIEVLHERGFEVQRVAGSSAGAIVGALLAAGMTVEDMIATVNEIKYPSFEDPTPLARVPLIGDAASIWFQRGINKGDAFKAWISEELEGLDTTTFGKLHCEDPDPGSVSADPRRAYRLVVTASDVSNQRLALLPWDFAKHYPTSLEDPDIDGRSVVDAVCCSMAIPLFYKPRSLSYATGPSGTQTMATMVDGGMLSNFPVWVFDRTDRSEPRWPTFGIKLSARQGPALPPPPIRGPIAYAKALVGTMTGSLDRVYANDPKVIARTMFVDTFGVSATKFNLKDDQREQLYKNGRAAAEQFLDGDASRPPWNPDEYVEMMTAGPSPDDFGGAGGDLTLAQG